MDNDDLTIPNMDATEEGLAIRKRIRAERPLEERLRFGSQFFTEAEALQAVIDGKKPCCDVMLRTTIPP